MSDDPIRRYLMLVRSSMDGAMEQHADDHLSAAKSHVTAAISAVRRVEELLDDCEVIGPSKKIWFYRLLREANTYLVDMGDNIPNPERQMFHEACGEAHNRIDQVLRLVRENDLVAFPQRTVP